MKKPLIIEILVWTILLIIIFSGIIFTYSKVFVEPNIYTIEFKDIDGITKGSPVRFMGVNVGYVRNLKSIDKHINVQIIITKKGVKIPNGTIARVEFFGLGGSKSIELMPPDGSCDVGILTDNTIRINDVMNEAIGLIEVIEQIEKFVKSLDNSKMQKILETTAEFKNSNILDIQEEITKINSKKTTTIDSLKEKQGELINKIKKANKTTQDLNSFFKKH